MAFAVDFVFFPVFVVLVATVFLVTTLSCLALPTFAATRMTT